MKLATTAILMAVIMAGADTAVPCAEARALSTIMVPGASLAAVASGGHSGSALSSPHAAAPRRLLSGSILDDSAAQQSGASADGDAANAVDAGLESSSSASNGAVSASANTDWDFPDDNDVDPRGDDGQTNADIALWGSNSAGQAAGGGGKPAAASGKAGAGAAQPHVAAIQKSNGHHRLLKGAEGLNAAAAVGNTFATSLAWALGPSV